MLEIASRHVRSYVTLTLANRYLLLFGLLFTFGSSFGQTYVVSIFSPFLMEEFGLSNGEIGSYYAIGTLVSAFAIIWIGKFLDTVPLKWFLFAPCLGLAAACLFMTFIASPMALLFGFFLLRFFGQGMMTQTGTTTIAREFEEERGRALSISSLGFSLGQAFLPVVGLLLIGMIGWRLTFVVCAVMSALVYLPLGQVLLMLSERKNPKRHDAFAHPHEPSPQELESEQSDLPVEAYPIQVRRRQWTRGEMIRDYRFYMLIPAFVSGPFIVTAILWNQVYISDIKGWDREWMASMLAVMAATQIVTTFVVGPLVDKFTARRLLPMSQIPGIIALLVLIFVDHPLSATAAMFFFGIRGGIGMVLTGSIWPELYGVRHLGAIRSLTGSVMVVATATPPLVFGFLIDAGVTLAQNLSFLIVFSLIAMLLSFLVIDDRHKSPLAEQSN